MAAVELLIFNKMTAYCFKPGERVPAEILRIVREEIESAAQHLTGPQSAGRDEAIHEARKSVKKIRGVLRLMQPEMGELYPLENTLFRDIGRQLSQFRDGGATIEIFDELRKKYRGDLDGRVLAKVRRRLVSRKAQAEKEAHIGEVLGTVAAALDRSAARLASWPLAKDGFAAIAPGLEATLRRGQKAMARAHKHARPENFHDWRKRVKEHWYHVRLVQGLWNHDLEAYEKKLKDLEEALGEDHNLVVLQEKLSAEPTYYGTKAEIRAVIKAIDDFHETLRGAAFEIGEKIYNEKPSRFTRSLRRLWKPWQELPQTAATSNGPL